jgi:hypothetical protein
MKVLVDHHHGALLKSMYYLFKKRYNFDVYLPTGFDWLDKELLYSSYPYRGTADQMLNSWTHDRFCVENFIKADLEIFINTEFDIIVCTLLDNYKIFEDIIKKYNKKCKLILHIGNNNPPSLLEQMGVKNLMSSSWPVYLVSKIPNKVFCRQEFSLDFFKPKYDCNVNSVANYKNILDKEEYNTFLNLEKKLSNWSFKCYGTNNRDGIIPQTEHIMAESMRDFGFIYHFKKIDEGYGHVIHNAFACGKPVITNSNYMKVNFYNKFIGNTPSLLFEPNITILDLTTDSIDDIKYKLEKFSDSYKETSERVYNKFKNTVDFEKESESVRQFIINLI